MSISFKRISKPVAALVFVVLAIAAYIFIEERKAQPIPAGVAFGNGRIEAVQVDIATRIPGRVREIVLREGDTVYVDQEVAYIDSAQLQAQLLRARAEVASAQSQVEGARAAIAQANAQLVLAQQELNRVIPLAHKGLISKDSYDTKVSLRDIAKANLLSAEAALVSQQRNTEATQAIVEEIETQIEDCTLVSPAFGRVLYRLAEPGEVLGSGGKVLTIVNMDEIYMEIFLPSSEAHLVSVGSEARIKLDVLDFVLPAKVSFVSPESQFTPKQVETTSERDKLMFRIKVRIPSELIHKHVNKVKTGVRGVAYVRLDNGPAPEWDSFLPPLGPENGSAASTD